MPGFDFDFLIEEIRNGKVVPIIGTELYADQHDASLDDVVAGRLATELGITAAVGMKPRDVALAYLADRGDLPRLANKYKKAIEDSVTEPPAALTQLAQITDFKLYVTTAIDPMMETALKTARGDVITTAFSPLQPAMELPEIEKTPLPVVCHLLGQLDGEFPLGDADVIEYVHALLSETRRPQKLFDELRNRDLLFIGCGFPDWLLRIFIRTVKDKEFSYAERRAQFIADARATSDQNLMLFLTHYNLKVHPSGPATKFVDELFQRWSAMAQPKPARIQSAEATMTQDSVFLSFSSEDRETVREISKRLVEAGIPVWFDETGIEPGADWDRMIQDNLLRTALFVPFISTKTESLTETAKYFWMEWNLADKRSAYFPQTTKFILPIGLDPVNPPDAHVPDSFKRAQWFPLPGRVATAEFIEYIKTEYRRKQARPR